MKFNYFVTLFVVIVASYLLLEVECEKQKEGKKERGKDKSQSNGNQKEVDKENKNKSGTKISDGKEQKSKRNKSAPEGNFATKDKAQCTWAVTGNDILSLSVNCQQGINTIWCEFTGRPTSCSDFQANQKNYWKQIARALKKQNNICREQSAVLKSKVCKKGPGEAHLKLTNSFLHANNPLENVKENIKQGTEFVPAVDSNNVNNNCTDDSEGNVDYKTLAEEYCGESWSSMCTFFLSMFKNKSC
ncbi:fibroblast growth factor-binding protein 1 [Protopterus annectens]|uniref:fibroblast growth factor-binding protein 1 n=1 Tax=Protopterus annectens TaxID=7888 RepID=UPI001CFBB4EC|nr:fibroblast growth factor-binding protein 1 [Protopterus annectens]